MIHLKDYVLSVNVRNGKVAISEMYITELKFEADYLLKWFNAKCKSINLEVSNNAKRKCEIENPIDWLRNRWCICTFPLEINATKFDTDTKKCLMLIL